MKIEFLMLADAAQVVGGKLYALGGCWNTYRSMNFPVNMQVSLVVSILVDWSETGKKHPIRIVIADEAGIPIIPELQGQAEVGRSPDMTQGSTQRIVFTINAGVLIPRPGSYSVTATAGAAKKDISFEAIFTGKRVEVGPRGASPSPSVGN